eukprot:3565248-Rhodomonas_salina.1
MQQAAKRRRISRKNGEKKDPRSSWVSELVKEKQGLVDPKSLPQKRASQLKREGPSNAERRWAQEVFKDVPDKFKTKKQEPKQVERTGEQKAKSELVVKKGGVNMTAVIEGDIDEKKLTVGVHTSSFPLPPCSLPVPRPIPRVALVLNARRTCIMSSSVLSAMHAGLGVVSVDTCCAALRRRCAAPARGQRLRCQRAPEVSDAAFSLGVVSVDTCCAALRIDA